MSVHAHPDDESSKGAGTVAKYRDAGVHTILVCCTGGEEGDILNPAMDREDIRANLPAIRSIELSKAAGIIGYDIVERLGYRDSGMAGTPPNEHPDSFAQAKEEEAVGKLVKLIREHRPHVIITYDDEQELYPHPDHLRTHDISVLAYEAASDGSRYPEAGEPWAPSKLYYSWQSHRRMMAMIDAVSESMQDMTEEQREMMEKWKAAPSKDHRITTRIDVADYGQVRMDALRAHATQIDPNSPIWFVNNPETDRDLNGIDDYVLAQSSVQTTLPETDLFAGLEGAK